MRWRGRLRRLLARPAVACPAATVPDPGTPHWSSLHGAWQDATDAHEPAPGKEPLPVAVVIAITEHRVRDDAVLRIVLDHDPSLRQRIQALRPHTRDAQGRNWNIPPLADGASPQARDEDALRRVVDALRDRFDLA